MASGVGTASAIGAPGGIGNSNGTALVSSSREQDRATGHGSSGRVGAAPNFGRIGLRDLGQGTIQPSVMRADIARTGSFRSRTSLQSVAPAAPRQEMRDIRKDPRRRTIFIPEDTTMLTIHPGANSTARLDDTFQLMSLDDKQEQQNDEAAEDVQDKSVFHKRVRRPRKSLMAAPRRGPLIMRDVEHKQNTESWDVCGENTGKENLPPGGYAKFKAAMTTAPEARLVRNAQQGRRTSLMQQRAPPHNLQIRHTDPTAAQETEFSTFSKQPRASILPGINARAIGEPVQRNTAVRPSLLPISQQHTLQLDDIMEPKGTGINASKQNKPTPQIRGYIASKRLELAQHCASQYPVLQENLPQSALYETEWLAQQEVSLTEVVNEIFCTASSRSLTSIPYIELRKGLVELYHQDEVTLIAQRIKASTEVGWLAKPKNMPSPDLSTDIGLRKAFQKLWTETYNEDVLCAAMEVVVGHEMHRSTGNDLQHSDVKPTRVALTRFLHDFFIFAGDVRPSQGFTHQDDASVAFRWQKITQRSLMLVWLLDQAKTSGLWSGTLFKEMSSNKSSTAVLRALGRILTSSIGDMGRYLNNLGYDLTHVQDALDEVVYGIENLAVDLRDGICLAHLVEILLYPGISNRGTSANEHAPITITFPDQTILQSEKLTGQLQDNKRILSQHLRVPAMSRTVKVFNVQVALSALESSGIRGANVVGGITAEDIVDGHREKTLSLLWSLVSVYGLNYLVDWEELCRDIARTEEKLRRSKSTADLLVHETREQQELALTAWADGHAMEASMGGVLNLNTSFADGKAYLGIVEAFQPYLPETQQTGLLRGAQTGLKAQLERIGCSSAFIKQLLSSVGTIPHCHTTISNLVFLASRLLPLSKKHYAAVKIQRAWRKHREPIIATQRIALMRLAHDCATVVQISQRMEGAALTIQRAFRAHVDRRIGRIHGYVREFQDLARGWIVRGAVRPAVRTERVMGGW